jgi:hypothetical protein
MLNIDYQFDRYMLGEQIVTAKGKSIGQRVLNVEEGLAKIEISFSESGKLKEIEFTNIGLFGLLLDLEGHSMEKGKE